MRCILLLIEGDAARHVSTSNYRELDESRLPQAPHLFEANHMRLSVSTPLSRGFSLSYWCSHTVRRYLRHTAIWLVVLSS